MTAFGFSLLFQEYHLNFCILVNYLKQKKRAKVSRKRQGTGLGFFHAIEASG